MDDIFKMVAAVELAIETVVWVAHEPVDQDDEMRTDARIFHGMTGKYLFTVASFDIEDQGFPPGSRGYDGAVRCGSNVVRLTRPQAKRACELAEIAVAGAVAGTGVC